jgi:hypothetical protein
MAYESREPNRQNRIGRIRTPASRARTRSRRTTGAGRDLDTFVRSNAGVLTLVGLTLGVFISRRFLVLPIAVAAMIAQDTLLDRLESRLSRI